MKDCVGDREHFLLRRFFYLVRLCRTLLRRGESGIIPPDARDAIRADLSAWVADVACAFEVPADRLEGASLLQRGGGHADPA